MICKSHKTIRWTWKWCQQHVYHCAASSLPLSTAHKHLEQLLGSWERNVVPFWFETWIYLELRVLLLFGLEDFLICVITEHLHTCFKLALLMLLEHVCSSTHDRPLTCVYTAQWAEFTDRDFWKFSWTHPVISMTESCLVVTQCRLRAEDHGQPLLIFSLVPCAQRFLQILGISRWHYAL